ncbi:MAG: histone deacetylase [Chloroflexi bacterium]|nr:MAG: histone deacetylase [Chloroflexota bacterium]MBL1196039.1 histone deacetylase [Chloroflexota bacterium]NOH13333.1 histone deacetylase [Chloroflexota bacterium]
MHEIVYFYPAGHEAHAEYGHPERPERVEAIKSNFKDAGLWEPYPKLEPVELADDVLHKVHEPGYLERLQNAIEAGQRHIDADTYLTPESWQLALNAAGGAAAVAMAVWSGEAKRGFALPRPPGHHATPNRAMGFCLLNNDAIAAQAILSAGAERVAIVDFDIHHGNGTQDIFWERADVLFISTHQYPLYPGTGLLNEAGSGAGKGTTVNLPLPPYSGDTALMACMQEIMIPQLERYQPEMLLITAGFDAHWRDPLGHLLASADGFGKIMSMLTKWADDNCQGRIAMMLAGGYDVEAGAVSALAATQSMLGAEWQDPIGSSQIAEEDHWRDMLEQAHQIWKV